MMDYIRVSIMSALCVLLASCTTLDGKNVTIKVLDTQIKGIEHARNETQTFRGLPYAQPPVGNLRFAEPKPFNVFEQRTSFDASKIEPSCIQARPLESGSFDESEDCLTLNITRPAQSNKPLPVMVWIYGGGFMGGGTNMPVYDPSLFVKDQQVIVASMNYRTGLFGFYSHESMDGNDAQRAIGNFGLLDQVLALKWIKQHIAQFGGDPNNITIFGQSAGGFSACLNLVSPLTKGLFHKVIMQSGSCGYPVVTKEEAFAHGERLANLLGCEDNALSCMRGYSVKELKKKIAHSKVDASLYTGVYENALPRVPVIDDHYLPAQPVDVLSTADIADVPVLLGFTKNEGSIFLVSNRVASPTTDAEYEQYLQREVGEGWQEVYQQYPVKPGASGTVDAVEGLVGDSSISCGVIRTADDLNQRDNPVTAYEFDLTANDFLFKLYFSFIAGKRLGDIGSFHSIEIPYIFQSHPLIKLSDEENIVSQDIMDIWGSFAKSGVPAYRRSGQSITLTPYDRHSKQSNVISRSMTTGSWLTKAKKCEVLERVYPFTFDYTKP